MNSIKVCEYSRSRSFHDDLILQDQASGERSQDQWSSGFILGYGIFRNFGIWDIGIYFGIRVKLILGYGIFWTVYFGIWDIAYTPNQASYTFAHHLHLPPLVIGFL